MSAGPNRLLSFAALIVVFAAAMSSRADADLWGHVRFGLDTLQVRHLSSVDPYSFTQDKPWINHEWLSELQMGAAYAAAGPGGLQLLKAGLVSTVVVLIWTALAQAQLVARLTVFLVVVIGTIQMWATIRPQLWSLLCLALTCRILASNSSRLRWWLPPIFVFWANCHGGWVVGLGVLGVWAVASIVTRPAEWRGWISVVAGSAIATLCNPYGWRLWEFVLRTVRLTRSIEEWQPLWRAPGLNWVPWIAAVSVVLWLVVRGRSERTLTTTLVLTTLAYGAVRVQRIESLFVVSAAILIAPWIAARWPAARGAAVRSSPVELAVSLCVTAGAVALAAWLVSRSFGCIPIFGNSVPDRAPAQLLEHAESGRLVTYFDWGEYAIWHFGPGLKVSMDGRRETVYSDARIADHDAIVKGTPAGLATLESWHPEYVWLPAASTATKRWLAGHGYRIEAETRRSFVAVRADLPTLVMPDRAPMLTPWCFPG